MLKLIGRIWHDPVWSKVIAAGIVAILVGSWSGVHFNWWPRLLSTYPAPFWLLVLLIALTLLGFTLFLWKQHQLGEATKERTRLSPPDGPNVVVEYSYSDSDGPAGLSQPLVLKNISNRDPAHNIRVLPMTVGELNATFLPDVVPFIEPLNQKEVKVNIDGVSPILRDNLPVLFRRSYKDKDTNELFSPHPYILLIEYEDADCTKLFETSVVLRYKPWKNKISIGETRRRLKKLM